MQKSQLLEEHTEIHDLFSQITIIYIYITIKKKKLLRIPETNSVVVLHKNTSVCVTVEGAVYAHSLLMLCIAYALCLPHTIVRT